MAKKRPDSALRRGPCASRSALATRMAAAYGSSGRRPSGWSRGARWLHDHRSGRRDTRTPTFKKVRRQWFLSTYLLLDTYAHSLVRLCTTGGSRVLFRRRCNGRVQTGPCERVVNANIAGISGGRPKNPGRRIRPRRHAARRAGTDGSRPDQRRTGASRCGNDWLVDVLMRRPLARRSCRMRRDEDVQRLAALARTRRSRQ
jgi:hypothetical protein